MQGSFEKKVQEKLDELTLDPSAQVWEKIESEIRPEKKRRRGLFWLSFLILFLGGAGWWIFSGSNKPTPVSKTNAPVASTGTLLLADSAFSKQPKTLPAQNGTIERLTSSSRPTIPKAEQRGSGGKRRSVIATGIKKRQQHPEQKTLPGASHSSVKKDTPLPAGDEGKNSITTSLLTKNTKQDIAQKVVLAHQEEVKKDKTFIAGEVPVRTSGTDTLQVKDTAVSGSLFPATADTSRQKTKSASLPKKWRKVLLLQGGLNTLSASFFSTNLFDVFSNPITTGTNYSTTPSGPNGVTGGASVAIGAGGSKTIGKRWELTAGLQYAHNRLHTKMGNFRQIDTGFLFLGRKVTVDGYYRNGNATDYAIHHHLLQVPVSLRYRPLLSLPLFIQAGAAYGRLLSSNALTYNGAANGYYDNKENLTKHFFSVSASLQYNVFKQKSWEAGVGLFVDYQLSPLYKQATGNNGHLSAAGLRSTIHF